MLRPQKPTTDNTKCSKSYRGILCSHTEVRCDHSYQESLEARNDPSQRAEQSNQQGSNFQVFIPFDNEQSACASKFNRAGLYNLMVV